MHSQFPTHFLQIFGGNIGEKFGPRKSLSVMAILWAFSTVMTGLATGMASLFVARLLLGVSESGAFPTATRAISRWFPKTKRSSIQGIVKAGARVGNALAPLIVAALISWAGWRSAFFYTALISVFWSILWYKFFRNNPKNHPAMTKKELAELPDEAVDDEAQDAAMANAASNKKKHHGSHA